MEESGWILCLVCGNKTRDKVWEDTELINFPLFCPKCKRESFSERQTTKSFGHHRASRSLLFGATY